jgi:hypothetical protein
MSPFSVGIRKRLDALDERARVQDESPAWWFLAPILAALTAVVVAAAATRRSEVLLFVPIVVGIYIGRRWSQRN